MRAGSQLLLIFSQSSCYALNALHWPLVVSESDLMSLYDLASLSFVRSLFRASFHLSLISGWRETKSKIYMVSRRIRRQDVSFLEKEHRLLDFRERFEWQETTCSYKDTHACYPTNDSRRGGRKLHASAALSQIGRPRDDPTTITLLRSAASLVVFLFFFLHDERETDLVFFSPCSSYVLVFFLSLHY